MKDIPRLPHALFKWYCRTDRYEEIHGDLEELFAERKRNKGLRLARLLYFLDVLRCCQPYAWKKFGVLPTLSFTLYKNYTKITWRVLTKNPLSSTINIFGLALAIGFSVLVFAFGQWVYSTDQFHEKKERVFLVTHFADIDGNPQQHGVSPRALASVIRQDISAVSSVCHVEDNNAVVKVEDKTFYERIRFADASFLNMFTFPLKWGSPKTLSDINSVILSEEMSDKYFGKENPIGRDIQIVFGEGREKSFKVTGVAEKFPVSRSFSFTFLVNIENIRYADPLYKTEDWSTLPGAVFVELSNPNQAKEVTNDLARYVHVQNEARHDWKVTSFALEPLSMLYRHSDGIRNSISRSGFSDNKKAIYFLVAVGLTMLCLACANYINIAVVSAAKRFKEIGVRKSIGATNKKVIGQFLVENIILTGLALFFGILLGTYVIVPWFEQINSFKTGFTLAAPAAWIFLLAALIATGIASGIYPAYFVSRFQTIKIFRGAIKFGKQNILTKSLLGLQVILACIAITFGVMFTRNSDYLATRPWGYQYQQVLYSAVPAPDNFEQLQTILKNNSDVIAVSGSREHIGKAHRTSVVQLPDRKYEVQEIGVGASYFETMGIELQTGRFFDEAETADEHSIVVNETLVRNLELTNPVGQQMRTDSTSFTIVGVVKDFYSYSFSHRLEPLMFTRARKEEFKFLAVKVQPEAETKTFNLLQSQWATLFPSMPFQGGYQEDVWGPYFQTLKNHGQVWQFIAIAALTLASLGLYGVVVFNVAGRAKEFSVRKLLGATGGSVGRLLLRQYALLFFTSLAIGGPCSYLMVKAIFDFAYRYHIPVDLSGTLTGVGVLLSVLFIVVAIQVRRVQKDNPIDGLKTE